MWGREDRIRPLDTSLHRLSQMRDAGGRTVMQAPFVIDDRERSLFKVNRSALTDAEVFRQEQEHILSQVWLYVPHESEVAKANDFRSRNVAGRPVVLTRGQDGSRRWARSPTFPPESAPNSARRRSLLRRGCRAAT